MSTVGPSTIAVPLSSYAGAIHVSGTTGSDKSGDGSKSKPWASVERGLAAASSASADRRMAVLVAAGTYAGSTIECRPFVDLYGGFDGKSWERDIFSHETVLDGLGARRVLIGANNSRIDGFVITRGRAAGHGGALLCDSTSPTISNNRFIGNHTLAPVDVHPHQMHQDGHRGGAVACLFDAVPKITNNVFSGNWTEFGDGGALAVYGWVRLEGRPHAVIANNVFVDNTSGTKDITRTRSSSGGAIACSHEASPEIVNNVVAHNQAMGRSDAGGIYVEYYSSPEIVGNWIVGNEGDDDGGGIYTMRDGEPLIRRNIIAGNWTTGGGVGAVRVSKEGRARIVENIIVNNLSGGAVRLVDGYAVVEGNLIAENRGGPGVFYEQLLSHFQPSVVRNNQFSGNEKGGVFVQEPNARAPVVEGNRDEIAAPVAGAVLDVAGASFDARAQATTLTLRASAGSAIKPGRIIYSGTHWTVVRAVDGLSVQVWGDFSAAAASGADRKVELLPDYVL